MANKAQSTVARAYHVVDQPIRMTHHVDDCVQLVRAEGIVLLRETRFASCGKIVGANPSAAITRFMLARSPDP